jgi:hypothetical protein
VKWSPCRCPEPSLAAEPISPCSAIRDKWRSRSQLRDGFYSSSLMMSGW